MTSAAFSSAIGMVVLMVAAQAHAECTMDTECEGDLVCEKGSCAARSPAASQVVSEPPAVAPPAAVSPAVSPVLAAQPPPRLVRHSEIMMGAGVFTVVVGGAVFVSAVGAALAETACGIGPALYGQGGSGRCDENDGYILGGFLTSMALLSVGIPLIVAGKRLEPASPETSAALAPWVGRQSAGVSLRFAL